MSKLCEYAHNGCLHAGEECYDSFIQRCFIYKGKKEEESKEIIEQDKGLVSKLKEKNEN